MAFGRGKVILLGEHGVVHGRPALAAGLGRGVRATAARASADALMISGPGADPGEAGAAGFIPDPAGEEPLARAFHVVLEGYGARPFPAEVRCECDLPAGAGLGCSAAIGVAVVGALDALYGVTRTPEARGAYCLAWEKVFHGNPSGVDNTMAAVGGVHIYRKGQPLEPLEPRAPLLLVVGHSGESSSTKTMVEGVAHFAERWPEEAEKIFDGMASLVGYAKVSLEQGNLRHMGQLMDLNQKLLSSLMLSTDRIETLCAAARDAGALGAKVTGAGGGGCMIALVGSEAEGEAVMRALRTLGCDPFLAEAGA
jgi:mevalonate kinase